ncbi:MAG: ribosomal RNA small subunit methyltransferase A [Candidatus Omnitrophica bacterium]|nr:ribosomal RNA small subunit methyltransferase A [Candidatus Omnitrophota bacterium]
MLTKNELKTLWKREDFKPLVRLGQNFLIDKNVKDKILRNLAITPDDIVVEIGSGFGELTFDLAKHARKVFAVEKDKKITRIFKKTFQLPPNVALIEKDFLDLEIKEIAKQKVIIYGNLPFYITSPIIEKLFENVSLIKNIYIVVQKEVAGRIAAKPDSRDIGRFSLYVQYYSQPKTIFKIKRESFYPAPQVESAFLELKVPEKRRLRVSDEDLFFNLIKKAYSQRRKTIRNSLSAKGVDKKALLALFKKAGLNPLARAENLSLEDFARLTDIVHGLDHDQQKNIV